MFQERKEILADSPSPSPSVKEFGFDDLKIATRKFNQHFMLGWGAFGMVFLGWVDQNTLAPSKQGVGLPVAIKRLNKESLCGGPTEWLGQVNILGQLAHPNIIRLLGCCSHEDERLLVYEYMPNKGLDRLLFANGRVIVEPLSWGTRVLIMIGVARGLAYLHSRNLILRDLKCSHILLDEEFNAKLRGFSLARDGPETGETHVSTRVMGTSGASVAPEYITTGHLSMKCDIYMFGVVLLESISSRKAIDFKQPYKNLVVHVSEVELNRRNVKEIMDPRLGHNYPLQGALEYVALAFKCLVHKPRDRPSIEEVLESLEQIYVLYK